MNLGQVRKEIGALDVFGFIGDDKHRLGDNRNIVVQVHVADHPEFGPLYEYREVTGVGSLFMDGEFIAVIAAGEKV
jgi:hypothetical protein